MSKDDDFSKGFKSLKSMRDDKSNLIDKMRDESLKIEKELRDDEDYRNTFGRKERRNRRKIVLKSLINYGSDFSLKHYEDMLLCKEYNIERLKSFKKTKGPYWRRKTFNDFVVWDTKWDRDFNEPNFRTSLRYVSWEDSNEVDTFSRYGINKVSEKRHIGIHIFDKNIESYLSNKKGKNCQSLWCNNCRYVLSSIFLNKIQKRLDRGTFKRGKYYLRRFMSDYEIIGKEGNVDRSDESREGIRRYLYRYETHHLRMISGYLGICKVDYKEVEKLLEEDNLKWRRIRRNIDRDYFVDDDTIDGWIEVAYEIELINYKFLKGTEGSKKSDPRKIKGCEQLMEHHQIKDDVFLLVHFHGLTNLSKSEIRRVFGKEYFVGDKHLYNCDVKCGLHIQELRKDKLLSKSIETICSYPFKDPISYKHTFLGSDYKSGESFLDRELSSLIEIYHKIQGKNWRRLFREVTQNGKNNYIENIMYYGLLYPPHCFVWNLVDNRWLVDRRGNVFTFGWNVDLDDSQRGVMTKEVKIEKIVAGREHFLLPQLLPEMELKVYKNFYDYIETIEDKLFSFEEYLKSVWMSSIGSFKHRDVWGRNPKEWSKMHFDYEMKAKEDRDIYGYVRRESFNPIWEHNKRFKTLLKNSGVVNESSLLVLGGEDINHLDELNLYTDFLIKLDKQFFKYYNNGKFDDGIKNRLSKKLYGYKTPFLKLVDKEKYIERYLSKTFRDKIFTSIDLYTIEDEIRKDEFNKFVDNLKPKLLLEYRGSNN